MDDCRDSFVFQDLLTRLWSACPPHKPLLVSIWLADVTAASERTPGLFDDEPAKSTRASEAMDALNRRFGAGTLYPASLHDSRTAARRGIAFRKVPDLDQF